MAATIQQIVKPTRARGLDTSGNNNHAQIYSGRALEFDGVTDYLDTNMTSANAYGNNTNFTVTAWYKCNGNESNYHTIVGNGSGWSAGVWLVVKDNDIRFNVNNLTGGDYALHHDVFKTTDDSIHSDTWYRIVATYDSVSGAKIYLNGIEALNSDGMGEPLGDANHTGNVTIGAVNHDISTAQYLANASICDVQIWNSTWTAADAEYDYFNPEQLALNRGGTSLTNSNLKLWYPMNEGHRGNQSFVLDASNTGLSDNIVDEAVSTGDSISGWASGFGDTGLSTEDGAIKVVYNTHASGAFFYLRDSYILTEDLVVGRTYKLTVRAKVSDSEVTFKIQGSISIVAEPLTSTEYVETTMIFNAGHVTDHYFFTNFSDGSRVSGQTTLYIDSITLKPINAKNNATTVFYGDEMVANGNSEVTDPTTITINGVALADLSSTVDDSTAQNNTGTGTKSIKVLCDGDTAWPGVKWTGGDEMGLIYGRTYHMECYVYGNSGGEINKIQLKYRSNDSTTYEIDSTTTLGSWQKLSGTFTIPDDIRDIQVIAYKSSSSDDIPNTEFFYIDDISLKEVGVASGWTDADQQLDIPQTALQSYNQLAYTVTGGAPLVTITDGTTSQITTNNHSIAFWCFLDDEDPSGFHYLVEKGVYETSGYYMYAAGADAPYIKYVTNQSGSKQVHTSDTALEKGKWSFVVLTIENSGQKSIIYFNGEEDSTSGDTFHTAPVADATPMHLGSYSASTHPGNHVLTELSSWSKTLSLAEIQELYNDGLALDSTTHSASANLVGYWRNNGLAQWEDLSTNDYHGVVTGYTETMLITAGVDSSRDSQGFLMNRQRLTNCLNIPFLGYDDNAGGNTMSSAKVIVEKPNIDYETSGFSVEFWMKTAIAGEAQFIIGNQDSSNTGLGWHVRAGGGNIITFVVSDGTDWFDHPSDVNVCDEEWHHVACVYNPQTNAKTYIDGSLNVTDTSEAGGGGAIAAINPVGDLDIGNRRGTNDQAYIGQLDDIKIYEKQLELPEITRNYNAGKRSHR